MPRSKRPQPPFLLFSVPYRKLVPLTATAEFIERERGLRGSALIWRLGTRELADDLRVARRRPAGVVLILILPPASSLTAETDLLHVIGRCRPTAIVPHHDDIDPGDMKSLIRRPPTDLPVEFTEYLAWRGLRVDRGTCDIIRRTVRLARHLTTIASLSRTIYLSRRALGRRFRVERAAGAFALVAVLPDSSRCPPVAELVAEPALRRVRPGLSRRLRAEQSDEPAHRSSALDSPTLSGMGVADRVLVAEGAGDRSVGPRLAQGRLRDPIVPRVPSPSRSGPKSQEAGRSKVGLEVTPAASKQCQKGL